MGEANMDSSTGAEEVHWDLSHLYGGVEDPALQQDLDGALEAARAFHEELSGRLHDLDPKALREAADRYERIQESMARAATFAYLSHVTDTGDEARGRLLQSVREREAAVRTRLLFFELEWNQVPDNRADALLRAPELAPWRHYLSAARRFRPYLLSEAEERILAEKRVTGSSAWVRFFDQVVNEIPFTLDGRRLAEEEVLSRLYHPDRELRRRAASCLTEGLQGHLRVLTFIFNMVAADKATDDRLRGYPHWLAERNLDNEISDDLVESLTEAVVSRYDLVGRYYRLKRRLLGYELLYDYDRYAPLTETHRPVAWKACHEIVLEAFSEFSPQMAQIAERFFSESWIDAAVQQGKRGGAFSHPAVPTVHPYVMLNYTGRIRDVMTMAHELGHGVHQALAASQGYLNSQTPLTTAETASVFGEMLVFERLISLAPDHRERLALICGKIEDILATVFRQIAMNRFEASLHRQRRQSGELSSEALSDLWMETQRAMFDESVILTDDYRVWWSYIPHFLHTPGYVYAYAFGELLVLALISRYRELGESFVPGYLEMLSLGGSEAPEVVLEKTDVDLRDAGLWHRGLAILEGMIQQAEDWAR